MKNGLLKVTKRDWYDKHGGFKNSACIRKDNGKCWEYYVKSEELSR